MIQAHQDVLQIIIKIIVAEIQQKIITESGKCSHYFVSTNGEGAEELHLNTDHLLRRLMAAMWEAHGRAFHGYEVVGMEKLPPPGEGAFLVYYHGTIPLDAYYFIARHIIKRDRFAFCSFFEWCSCK
ncbi:unnamed protein product, partial [Hydatigera taeniaeformis]|uniref:CRAL-TRIO domain-containing protein n=1 Tax=Hydatigena taeniaeformis TaxID=6205 RepID=A0A0R3WXP6_HYDTA